MMPKRTIANLPLMGLEGTVFLLGLVFLLTAEVAPLASRALSSGQFYPVDHYVSAGLQLFWFLLALFCFRGALRHGYPGIKTVRVLVWFAAVVAAYWLGWALLAPDTALQTVPDSYWSGQVFPPLLMLVAIFLVQRAVHLTHPFTLPVLAIVAFLILSHSAVKICFIFNLDICLMEGLQGYFVMGGALVVGLISLVRSNARSPAFIASLTIFGFYGGSYYLLTSADRASISSALYRMLTA